MMARFDLSNYVTVDERIRRFYADHAGGSITTTWKQHGDGVVVQATVWRLAPNDPTRTMGDYDGIWATGLAYAKNINAEKELEKCETTAIGRALANAGFVKEGEERASREEMADIVTPAPVKVDPELARVKQAAYEQAGRDRDAAKALFQDALLVLGFPDDLIPTSAEADSIIEWFGTR